MSWTDERVELLKKLWGEGKTAAEIAKELGDVTRNAVIGKAHRLKLSNRVSPIQQNSKKPVKATTEEVKKPVVRKPLRREEVTVFTGEGIKLADLKDKMCRWPIGDPREENFRFCGCQAVSGLPYCGEHVKVAYQAATRNRILQAEDFDNVDTAKGEDKKEAASA